MNASTIQFQYRRSPYAESVEMDGEWIIFHAKNQTMTKLNELGGRIWAFMQEGATEAKLVSMILEDYQIPFESAQRDIRAFLASLVEIEAVELVG